MIGRNSTAGTHSISNLANDKPYRSVTSYSEEMCSDESFHIMRNDAETEDDVAGFYFGEVSFALTSLRIHQHRRRPHRRRPPH
jgi:hypothetical protein